MYEIVSCHAESFQSDTGENCLIFPELSASLINHCYLFYSPRNFENLVNRAIYLKKKNFLRSHHSSEISELPWAGHATSFPNLLASSPLTSQGSIFLVLCVSLHLVWWNYAEIEMEFQGIKCAVCYLCFYKDVQYFNSEKLSWVETWIPLPFFKSRWCLMIFDIIKNVKNTITRSTAFTVSSCEDDYCYISELDSWIGFFTDSLEICVSNQLIKKWRNMRAYCLNSWLPLDTSAVGKAWVN